MDQFSTETLALLSKYGLDLASAILATPDAELRRVSPKYAEHREQADEATAKRAMIEALGIQGRERSPALPPSERDEALSKLLRFATLPSARELISREIEQDRATRELSVLIGAADSIGEVDLARALGAELAAVRGLAGATWQKSELAVDRAQAQAADASPQPEDARSATTANAASTPASAKPEVAETESAASGAP